MHKLSHLLWMLPRRLWISKIPSQIFKCLSKKHMVFWGNYAFCNGKKYTSKIHQLFVVTADTDDQSYNFFLMILLYSIFLSFLLVLGLLFFLLIMTCFSPAKPRNLLRYLLLLLWFFFFFFFGNSLTSSEVLNVWL